MKETYQKLQHTLAELRTRLVQNEDQCPEAMKDGARALRLAIYGMERELRSEKPNLADYITAVTTQESSSNLIRYDTHKQTFLRTAEKIEQAVKTGTIPSIEDLLN